VRAAKVHDQHWETLKKELIEAVKDFERREIMPRGCNAVFISLIPKIDSHRPR